MLDPLDLHCLVSFRPEDFIRYSQHSAGCSAANFARAAPTQ